MGITVILWLNTREIKKERKKERHVCVRVCLCVRLPLNQGIWTVEHDKGDEEQENWEKPRPPYWSRQRQKQKQTYQGIKVESVSGNTWETILSLLLCKLCCLLFPMCHFETGVRAMPMKLIFIQISLSKLRQMQRLIGNCPSARIYF